MDEAREGFISVSRVKARCPGQSFLLKETNITKTRARRKRKPGEPCTSRYGIFPEIAIVIGIEIDEMRRDSIATPTPKGTTKRFSSREGIGSLRHTAAVGPSVSVSTLDTRHAALKREDREAGSKAPLEPVALKPQSGFGTVTADA
jgi:hypothetical protein